MTQPLEQSSSLPLGDTSLTVAMPGEIGTVVDPSAIKPSVAPSIPEVRDKIAWVIEQIAERCYVPSPPGELWAGMSQIISITQSRFQLDDGTSEALVRLAQEELWSKGKEDSSPVQRQLMIRRLEVLKRLLAAYLIKPKVELRYVYEDAEPNAETGAPQVREKLAKKKVTEGLDVAVLRQMRAIEDQIAALQGLHIQTLDPGDAMARVQKMLDDANAEEGGEGATVTVAVGASLSRQVKKRRLSRDGINDPTGQRLLEQTGPSKKVDSREVGEE